MNSIGSIIVGILIALLVIGGSVYAGCAYLKSVRLGGQNYRKSSDKNRQEIAGLNRNVVGISNSGTSLDDDPIYPLTDAQIGIS